MNDVIYPNVKVKLIGEDGNAFAILSRCTRAARKAGVSAGEIERFTEEATAGDYDRLLSTCMRWFDAR